MQEGGITASWDFGNYFSGGNPEPFGCNQEIRGENCLVLNVLTPQPGEGKRPVIVYIHGGGFASGLRDYGIGGGWAGGESRILFLWE